MERLIESSIVDRSFQESIVFSKLQGAILLWWLKVESWDRTGDSPSKVHTLSESARLLSVARLIFSPWLIICVDEIIISPSP